MKKKGVDSLETVTPVLGAEATLMTASCSLDSTSGLQPQGPSRPGALGFPRKVHIHSPEWKSPTQSASRMRVTDLEGSEAYQPQAE